MPIINTQLFTAARNNMKRKGIESKRAENKERKWARKEKISERAIAKRRNKKRPNFGLCACTKLKYCSILYLILEKFLLLVKKKKLSWQNLGLYGPANDPGPQMIPVPQMIPKLYRKWSQDRKGSPDCTIKMIPDRKWSPRHKIWKCEDSRIWTVDFNFIQSLFLWLWNSENREHLDLIPKG